MIGTALVIAAALGCVTALIITGHPTAAWWIPPLTGVLRAVVWRP